MRKFLIFVSIAAICFVAACRRPDAQNVVTIALSDPFTGFDTLTTEKSDAAADRVRSLMFNSLVRKTPSFDYEGDLASEIKTSDDGKAITFVLRDNVKFHDGRPLTSADVKYTFEELFRAKGYKSFAFFDSAGKDAQPIAHISSIETPDAKTVVFNIIRPGLKSQLLANLVAIPIVSEGSSGQLKDKPVGTGPFKFISFDRSQNTVELEAFPEYWDGPAKIGRLRVKTVTDASALQNELMSGGVDIAPGASNLPPDTVKQLGSMPNLSVQQFDGSNIQYIGLNTTSAPLDKAKVRQAIGYAIDREKIINELLSGQAKIASSILPDGSWAYSPGVEYKFDPAKARQLLAEAGYKNEPITFRYASGNAAYSSYAQAIQSMLKDAGLNIQIETLDPNVLRENLAKGQFQMNTGVWVGGNQDPIFFKDLFSTAKIPGEGVSCCNRGRYSNPEVDKVLAEADAEPDRAKAKELYGKAWQLISADLPLVPLWYSANMVIANKRLGNIKLNASGDWTFVKDVTVGQQ